MDRSYLAVYKIRLALVSPSPSRDRRPPPLNVFLMKQENADPSQPSNEPLVESYVTGDFPDDRAIENYSLEVYQKVKNGGRNEPLVLDSALNRPSKRKPKPKPKPKLSVSKKRGAGTKTKPKTKPRKQMEETKTQIVTRSCVKKPKTEEPTALESLLKAHHIDFIPTGSFSFLSSLSGDISLRRIHPDALKYRLDFKNTKVELCQKLFKYYNEMVFDNKLPHDLQMNWSKRLNKSAGLTRNRPAVSYTEPRSSRILFSNKVCDSAERLRDTLIHELCHAACWLVDEVKNGHGKRWRYWANKAMDVLPSLSFISRCHDYEIFTKYSYKCSGCGYTIGRHTKSLDTVRKRCGRCYGIFELFVNTRRASGSVTRRKIRDPYRDGVSNLIKYN